jgi:hypothetical protein
LRAARNKLSELALPYWVHGFSRSQNESTQMSKPTEEQIKVRAHELWEQAGKPEGREDEFWHQAEKELSQGKTSDEKSTTFLE